MPTPSPDWLLLDEFNFHPHLAASQGAVLVMFGQPHCGACRAWYRMLPRWRPDQLDALAYVDVAVSSALAHEFELFHLPAFVLYKNGAFHAWVNAPFSQQGLIEAVQSALSSAPEEAP
ncbi:thioredoxin family protein [Crenobacter sp. SG2305]|uniref:thioredoxin family protein n=1 Tax=Crenobacter oryzisoli TaxID=3056844 RepID=UPI0025AB51E8|nr:thioredoxin family protein [Crenobacter sp. SG2305]MDN0084838.1 thioredoxin family protein [Crenobacter sp. SG2305]